MKKSVNKGSIKVFWKLIKQSRLPWGWIALCLIVNIYYNDILYNIPFSTAKITSGDFSAAAFTETILYYVSYTAITILNGLLSSRTFALSTRKTRGILWSKMLTISENYYDHLDNSDLLSAVTIDVASGIPTFVDLIISVGPNIWFILRTLSRLFSYNWILVVSIIVFLPVKLLYTVIVGRKNYKLESEIMETTGRLTGELGEITDNLQFIKSYNMQEAELNKGQKTIDEYYRMNVKSSKLGALSMVAEQSIKLIEQFATLIVGVMLLQSGVIDSSEWIVFFLFLDSLSMKLQDMSLYWVNMKTMSGSLKRPSELIAAPVEDKKTDGRDVSAIENYNISFNNVSFSYGEYKALDNVSFEIKEGEKVALVGKSGSGKSTSISLIERFYNPTEGSVAIGGQDISEYRLDDFRNIISYVPQANQVFSSTIREALTYGNTGNPSDEEILKAAKRTDFIDYINLQKDGLDAEITGAGDHMSGGQLQRLIITREILKPSRIVLFDEPTSALDAKSALNIKDLILKDFDNKTVILVTHDLKLVNDMDRIIVLKDGMLIAEGTYNELIETCPYFVELINTQNMEEEEADL